MVKKIVFFLFALSMMGSQALAGGWDKEKGLDKMKLPGELVCIGCSLKKLDGANAQCNLYAHHAIGFKANDGTLWSIVDNERGHDVVRAHTLLEKKKAIITGWIYPSAHYIEIDDISVEGVSMAEIQKAGYEEDMLLAKRLVTRKPGQVPAMGHEHGDEHK